ncbi:MAG: hypothetical protein WB392_09655 [Methanotrichaceae archaeon]
MSNQANFRDSIGVERFLYSIKNQLLKGKISSSEANAASKLADTWLKAHKMSRDAEILKRLNEIETMLKVQGRTKAPDAYPVISDPK